MFAKNRHGNTMAEGIEKFSVLVNNT
jgi:beta-phosphoglucomutase-like phosphatase (HAD superfamily)